MKKILVYGWCHQLNIGDELFVEAFRKLFPDYQFTFHDHINEQSLDGIDAVFFGGGSFLLARPNITDSAMVKLKTLPIFYVGIGIEAEINPVHMALMQRAKLIATRSLDQVDRVKMMNPNTMWIPDLAYCLQSQVEISPKKTRSVLVMPNISVVPHNLDPYWKHASWVHFKSEFAQFLDGLVQEGYSIDFLSMCQGAKDNDDWPAGELISHMAHRNKYMLKERPVGIERVTKLVSQYSLVITQRFHGIILAEMTKTPYMTIYHHDKLKHTYPCSGAFLSYYNSSKHVFEDAFNHAIRMNFSDSLPIESNIFEDFSQKIIELVEHGALCRN